MNYQTKLMFGTTSGLLMKLASAVLVVAALLPAQAHALTCGQGVTSNVTLTADLVCQHQDGLEIQASNVTIDLNGHTISCVSPTGFMGSCQPVGPTSTGNCCFGIGVPLGPASGIVIRGPGVITGFSTGILFNQVAGLLIQGVTITGPAIPSSTDFDNHRGGAGGIQVLHTSCSPLAPGYTTIIEYNDISNQGYGIGFSGVSCALIQANNIHDNSWAAGGYGIAISDSVGSCGPACTKPATANAVVNNIVVRNGSNATQPPPALQEGGVLITGNTSPVITAATTWSSSTIRVETAATASRYGPAPTTTSLRQISR